jgi:hypothetical protein
MMQAQKAGNGWWMAHSGTALCDTLVSTPHLKTFVIRLDPDLFGTYVLFIDHSPAFLGVSNVCGVNSPEPEGTCCLLVGHELEDIPHIGLRDDDLLRLGPGIVRKVVCHIPLEYTDASPISEHGPVHVGGKLDADSLLDTAGFDPLSELP